VETPEDIDKLLKALLQEEKSPTDAVDIDEEDMAFLNRLIDSVKRGSRAILIVVDPEDEQMEYIVANASRAQAIVMLARMIQRTARKLQINPEG